MREPYYHDDTLDSEASVNRNGVQIRYQLRSQQQSTSNIELLRYGNSIGGNPTYLRLSCVRSKSVSINDDPKDQYHQVAISTHLRPMNQSIIARFRMIFAFRSSSININFSYSPSSDSSNPNLFLQLLLSSFVHFE